MNNRIFSLIILWILLSGHVLYASESSHVPLPNPDKIMFPPIHFVQPQAQRIVLENGIILYIYEDHELPLLNIEAVVRCGSNYDPIGKEGLAEITGIVLRTGGTSMISGNAIDEMLEYFAGTLSFSMNRDSGSVHMSLMKKDLDDGLNIFSQILKNPAFEDNKLRLAKDLKIEELRRIADDPQKLAFREFKKLLYVNNPAGRFSSITSVSNIQRDDLIQFYKKFFNPQNIMISITGDISREQAISKIQQYLGDWNETKKKFDIPPFPVKQKGNVYFLLKNIPQSIIISAQLAPGKKNRDAYPFEILDFIVGSGGFRSRIFQEVRNNLGLAYSTGSFYTKKGDYGVFGAYAMTKSESTAKVLSLIKSIIKDISINVVDKNELAGAVKSINNNFIFSFLSADQIAHQQLMIEYEALPRDYLVTYREKLSQVQAEDIRRVALKYLSSDNAVILIVGNENAHNQLLANSIKFIKIESTP
ncbi:MAG: pitrilysin family protein [Syntrophaceae bacterium]